METNVHTSKALLQRSMRQIDATLVPNRPRAGDAYRLAERLRKAPQPCLRRRISAA